jgi:RNA polymerase sigma-70 factor (ECF subfamily)
MHDQADERLRAGLVAGREDAFASLYDRYGRSLYRVAWTLLRSGPDAEDAVQEVFLGLARTRATLAKVENLRAYLFSALRHAAARLALRAKPDIRPVEELPDRSANAVRAVDADTADLLERGLAALPAEQREVLSLKIDGELTFAEIAAILGIRPNTAASRYRYALSKLRTLVDAERHEPRPPAPRPA